MENIDFPPLSPLPLPPSLSPAAASATRAGSREGPRPRGPGRDVSLRLRSSCREADLATARTCLGCLSCLSMTGFFDESKPNFTSCSMQVAHATFPENSRRNTLVSVRWIHGRLNIPRSPPHPSEAFKFPLHGAITLLVKASPTPRRLPTVLKSREDCQAENSVSVKSITLKNADRCVSAIATASRRLNVCAAAAAATAAAAPALLGQSSSIRFTRRSPPLPPLGQREGGSRGTPSPFLSPPLSLPLPSLSLPLSSGALSRPGRLPSCQSI